MDRIKALHVSTTSGKAGLLLRESQHAFLYDPALLVSGDRRQEISLIMPLRSDPWRTNPMLPVFQTFLPEGYLKDRIESKFGKVMKMDDMALLALSGGNAIGRLRVSSVRSAPERSDVQKIHQSPKIFLGGELRRRAGRIIGTSRPGHQEG